MRAAGVRLLAVRSRVVCAREFNRLLQKHGSKGASLSNLTLALAAGVIKPLPAGPVTIVCDKHGGRNRYVPFLSRHWPDRLFEVVCEGRRQSIYRFGRGEQKTEIAFRTGGESHLPTALASMVSKYLRELAMRAFNAFWCRQVEGLQDVPIEPRTASKVTINNKSHYPGESSQNLVGIDLVEIQREMPGESGRRVVLLTRPGGIVKYPIGRGGIVLNQIDYLRPDTAENTQKKLGICSNLLRNLGSSFQAKAGRR